MSEVVFTDDNFQETVIEASKSKPVLVDFFATWCGPCKSQEPIVEEVSKEMGDTAVVGKIDVDEHPEHAQKFGVMGIPSLKVFRNGEVVEEFTGLQQKQTLVDALNQHLS
ncbi:MAG: thioredoxin [Candidatus Gracilibacteria bacterium]|nr:thioredoxin [bacterium]MDZ4217276.1 thioredoxin [Candidatus Gracilibacteria bacterium]